MLPKSLRALFVTILCYYNPSDPIQLFNDFKNNLLEDFINQGMTKNEALAHCVFQLKEQCEQAGFDLFLLLPLPNATEILNQNINNNTIITTTEPNMWVLLNNDQNVAASMIFSSLHNRISQKCFYLDGPGGSGKTFLIRALIQKIDAENKNVLCVAWTGIAATLLPKGMTCHSAFSLLLNMDAVKFPQLTRKKRDFLVSVDFVIWDEAPMASGIALETVDLIFRDLMKNDLPFGGLRRRFSASVTYC